MSYGLPSNWLLVRLLFLLIAFVQSRVARKKSREEDRVRTVLAVWHLSFTYSGDDVQDTPRLGELLIVSIHRYPISCPLATSAVQKATSSSSTSVVVVHLVAGSKTGICSPSVDALLKLRKSFGERLLVSAWMDVRPTHYLTRSSVARLHFESPLFLNRYT